MEALKAIKWYWWVLLALAIIMTVYVVIVSVKTNPSKTLNKVIESDSDLALTAASSSFAALDRSAERAILGIPITSTTTRTFGSVAPADARIITLPDGSRVGMCGQYSWADCSANGYTSCYDCNKEHNDPQSFNN